MNYHLDKIPNRAMKPREKGLTMVMDKGLSVRQAEDLVEVAGDHTDIVKLGWATSYVSVNLQKKLDAYKAAGIPVYFGGTLFEAFIIRNQFEDYRKILSKYDLEYVEVSDGSITIPHEEKCNYIEILSKEYKVLSEIGSKDADIIIPPYKWIKLMKKELEAGSYKLIAEARESGNVGIFRGTGEIRSGLIEEILTEIPQETIIWEAPKKSQQVWFIKSLGCNVNLGNIAPQEVVSLETIRLGLRGDTFHLFLNGKTPN